jgi:ADP-ribose pyrophosphatase YjhB (NUDIX family)
VLGRDERQRRRDRGQRVAAVQRHPHQIVEDRAALAGRRVAVGQGRDAPGRVHGRRLAEPGEPDRRRRRPHQRAVARRVARSREVLGGGDAPRPAGPEHRAGLVADVRRTGFQPGPEAVEDVGLVQAAALDQRLRHQQRHLGVVGELAGLPAHATAAHLGGDAAGGRGEAVAEPAGRAELERRAERVTDRRADQRTEHPVRAVHAPAALRRVNQAHVNHPVRVSASSRKKRLGGICANIQSMFRDASGKTLADYPRPSVAVDTAVLTVVPDRTLEVLLVRRAESGEWALPGTFLHEGETLAAAVLRSLADKAGLRGAAPRQLHVFDALDRDNRGWVLSVAHVAVLPWASVEAVPRERSDDVCVRPAAGATGLPFDHDAIVAMAVDVVRAAYADRPDPEGLLAEPFTMRQLRHLHAAVGGRRLVPDSFRRQMLPYLVDTGRTAEGVVGRPAALYARGG